MEFYQISIQPAPNSCMQFCNCICVYICLYVIRSNGHQWSNLMRPHDPTKSLVPGNQHFVANRYLSLDVLQTQSL